MTRIVTTLLLAGALTLVCGGTAAFAGDNEAQHSAPSFAVQGLEPDVEPQFLWIYPQYFQEVVSKSKVSSNYAATTPFSTCKVGTTGAICTISSGKSATRSIQLAFGIMRHAVASSLSISASTSVTVNVSCQSPPMIAGQTWKAYAVGDRWRYKVKETVYFSMLNWQSKESGWLYAHDPHSAKIYCKI